MFGIEDFRAYLHKRGRSPNTSDAYTRDVANFLDYLYESGVDTSNAVNVTRTGVLSYILHLQIEQRSPASVSRALAAIKTFSRYAVDSRAGEVDFAADIQLPRIDAKTPTVLTVDEVFKLINFPAQTPVDLRDRAMLTLLYACGLKVTEMIQLEITDIYSTMQYVRCGVMGRLIPCASIAFEAVEEYRVLRDSIARDDTKKLILSAAGKPLTRQGVWKLLKHRAEQSELGNAVTPNALRTACARHMLENGAEVSVLREFLGLSSKDGALLSISAAGAKMRDVYNNNHPLSVRGFSFD